MANSPATGRLASKEPNLAEDPPLVPPPRKGSLSGAIRPPAQVARLQVVSRATKQTYSPAQFDKAAGKFLFQDLPGDATYDLVLTTADGRTIEGIDLDMPDARLARLAEVRRKDLGLPPPPAHAFSADDANEILQYVAKMEDFMDLRRTLYLRGSGARATALVELLRTKEYHSAKPGELIWRVELWYFQFSSGSWERIGETERVLRRERLPHEKWKDLHVEYYPQLSAHVDASGFAKAVDFAIPDKPDPSRGRPKNTQPELSTPPHVMGVEEKPAAATQPAAGKPKG
jgi:hypothetical protein